MSYYLNNTCKETTNQGRPCSRNAGTSGYCSQHNPAPWKPKKPCNHHNEGRTSIKEYDMNTLDRIKQTARVAKKEGYSREKALRVAPNAKPIYLETFMAEYDRYQPRNAPRKGV